MRGDNVYFKNGRKYIPFGVHVGEDYLGEGLWLVRKKKYSRSTVNVDAMKKDFDLQQVDTKIENYTLKNIAQLVARRDDMCSELMDDDLVKSKIINGYSIQDVMSWVLMKLADEDKKISSEIENV